MGLELKIKESDLDYAVEDIQIKGKKFWPFLKVFFFDAQFVKGGTQTNLTLKQKIKFFRSLLYGWHNWFKRIDYIVFSNSDQRKRIDGKYIDKSAEYIDINLKNVLHVELPVFSHFPIRDLKYKTIVSHLPLRLIEAIYAKVFLRRQKISGLKVAQSLNADFNTNINAPEVGKRFLAQYWMMNTLICLKKPKAIFMAVPYMKMGYVLAAREKNIKVIEMQHGTINKSHFGYVNYKNVEPDLFPHYLLAYGKNTLEVFKDGNVTFSSKNVLPIGHYYLHLIQNSSPLEKEKTDRLIKAKKSIAVSLQDDSIGKRIVPLLIEVAKAKPEWVIVFVPRKTRQEDYEKLNLPENIVFLPDLNVYEIINICDIHTTAFSTCAIEAPTLGKPNVLFNIENKAMEYYGRTLSNRMVTRIVEDVKEYIFEIEKEDFPSKEIIKASNDGVMVPNFDENLKEAFNVMKIK